MYFTAEKKTSKERNIRRIGCCTLMKFLGEPVDYLSRPDYCRLVRQHSLSQIQDISTFPKNVSSASPLLKKLCNQISKAPSLDMSTDNIPLPPPPFYALQECKRMHLHTYLLLCAQVPETIDQLIFDMGSNNNNRKERMRVDNI